MIQKPLDKIEKTDIDLLVSDAVREGRTIEYKQQVPGATDREKKEFVADVASFANASGGDLLYGVEEVRDGNGRPTGIPKGAPGLAGVNADQEVLRFEALIRDGIDPRIPGVQIRPINGFEQGPIIIVRLPRSWASPHMVTLKTSPRFFSRTSAGKFPLDVQEIRAAFVQSEALPDRIRRFREERLGKILIGETPIALQSGTCAIMHLVPVTLLLGSNSVDVLKVAKGVVQLPVLTSAIVPGGDGRLNLDGYVSFVGSTMGDRDRYTQLFRNGTIEAVDCGPFEHPTSGRPSVTSKDLELRMISGLRHYLHVYAGLEVEPPIVILLSLLGVMGYGLNTGGSYSSTDPVPIDRNTILLPDLVIDDLNHAADQILRPVFDLLWQACGLQRCLHYDDQGHWKRS